MNISDIDKKSRPAIQTDPLPQAGESLRWEIMEIVFGRVMIIAMVCLFLAVSTVLDWYRYFFHVVPTLGSAIISTLFWLSSAVYAIFYIKRMQRKTDVLRLGLRGERHIGHYLDDICRGLGYRVLHDIRGERFNVDHTIIGRGGIFTIETKNWTKPPKGTDARIVFDGKTLNKCDGTFDTHALAQVRANADFIRKLVATRTGRDPKSIRVFPVLLIPGWFIEDQSARPREIWVLGDKVLHTFLPNEPARIPVSDVSLFYESLAEYSRNFGK